MMRCASLIAILLTIFAATQVARAEPAARQLFGTMKAPAALKARAIGSYARGCLAGGTELAIDGPAWQAMRLSRNRNWGHPALVDYLERLAKEAQEHDGWPGLMVGDMAQPRGGPMLTGNRSHQIGLDADIWLKPMPDRRLTREEREKMSAVSMLARDKLSVDKKVWTDGHVKLLRRAASYPEVARIFVHPAIKKALCDATGGGESWLRKIRPWWGHHYHFHVRLSCPAGVAGCADQKPMPAGDGCGAQLDEWFVLLRKALKPRKKPTTPPKKKKPRKRRDLRLADLPSECRRVLEAASVPGGQKRPLAASLRRQAAVPLPDRNPQR